MGLIRICSLEEMSDLQGAAFETKTSMGARQIFVVRKGRQFFGYVNSCPHTGAPLNIVPGGFLSYDKKHILCSTHGALFEIDSGYCVSGPCKNDSLVPVSLEKKNGYLFVDERR